MKTSSYACACVKFIAWMAVLVIAGCAAAQGTTDVPVYVDSLDPTWIAGAWQVETVFDLSQTAVVASGTSAVEVNYTGDGYGGFGFDHRDSGWTFTYLYPNEYVALAFDLNPGASPAELSDLGITLDNGSAGSQSFGTLFPSLQANTWLHVELPMSAIDTTHDRFGRIFFFNNGNRHPHFYLDNLILKHQPDTTPPVISDVTVGGLYSEGATLTWNTDEVTHCVLSYSTGGGAATTLEEAADAYTAGHSQILQSLLPNTLYAFQITAADHQSDAGTPSNTSSFDGTFTTPSDSITGDPQVTFTIDPAQDNHPISPYIYGDNFFAAWNTNLNLTLGREGGNRLGIGLALGEEDAIRHHLRRACVGAHLGEHVSGADAVHRHTPSPQLDGQALGEAHHTGLRRCVRSEACRGDDRLGGRDVHHSPTVRRSEQVRQTQAHQARVGGEIHIERARPVQLVRVVVLEGRVEEGDTCVVDQHVDTAEGGHHVGHQPFQRGMVTDVGHEAGDTIRAVRRGDLVDHGHHSFSSEVDHCHPCTFVGEQHRRRPSHSRRRTRDQDAAPFDRARQRREAGHTLDHRWVPPIP